MKKNYFGIKTLFAVAFLFTALLSKAQCNASFTSSLGLAGSANFNSTSTGTTGGTTYYWAFGDGSNGSGSVTAHTYSVNGTYQVYLAISNATPACYDSTSASVVITNTVNPPCAPVVSFGMFKDSLAVPAIVWNASPNYPPNVTAANWSWGDGTSTLALYPSHTYSAGGLYNICVSVTVACAGTASACSNSNIYRTSGSAQTNAIAQVHVINNSPTGIKNNSAESFNIGLFPNPTTGEFILEMKNGVDVKFAEVSIVNIIGEVVYTSKEEITNGNFSKKINLNNISNGTYFVKTNTGNGVSTKKLIINK